MQDLNLKISYMEKVTGVHRFITIYQPLKKKKKALLFRMTVLHRYIQRCLTLLEKNNAIVQETSKNYFTYRSGSVFCSNDVFVDSSIYN